MIKVSFTEPDTPEWEDWKTRAAAAHEDLKELALNGEEFRINSRLYKEHRDVIFGAFHGKCAYCEVKFILGQTGDVEHFRPKRAVADKDDKVVKDHKGYYWRAYDWKNLLPSCAKCNRLLKVKKEDGTRVRVGKGIRFPLKEEGNRVFHPDDEDHEEPLFIHPIFDNPEKHLRYDETTGLLLAKTERGKTCIDWLGLNREGLPEARRDAYDLAKLSGEKAMENLGNRMMNDFMRYSDRVKAFERGEKAFSFAARMAVTTFLEDVKVLYETFFP